MVAGAGTCSRGRCDPIVATHAAISARRATPSLDRMCSTCALTVFGERKSSPAIAAFVKPSAIFRATSNSRTVSGCHASWSAPRPRAVAWLVGERDRRGGLLGGHLRPDDGGDPGSDLRPSGHAQLREDVFDMRARRLWCDDELLGDLAVRQPLGDEPRDLELSGSQRSPGFVLEASATRGPRQLLRASVEWQASQALGR